MKTVFLSHFSKDLDKIKDIAVKAKILNLILKIEELPDYRKVPDLKKLKSYKYAFRIKCGSYRIGVFIEKNTINLHA